MAATSTDISFIPSVLHAVGAPFRAVGRFMITIMENDSRLRRAESLHAMTDEQLAQLGIRRDEIAHHVFKAFYAI